MAWRGDNDRPSVVFLFPEDLRQELREAHERQEAEEERRRAAERARQNRHDELERELLKWLQHGQGPRQHVPPTQPPDQAALAAARNELLADWLKRRLSRRHTHLFQKGHPDYCIDKQRFYSWKAGKLFPLPAAGTRLETILRKT
jgi:hypothetical protein